MLAKKLRAMMVAVILVVSCGTSVTTEASRASSPPITGADDAMPHRLAMPLIVSSFCTLVGETQYYVAPYGDDGGYGSKAMPFRTIQKAIDVAQAGDTVYVRAGRYHETVRIGKSGTKCAPITLAAYPGERPVIDGEYSLPPGPDAVCDPKSGRCSTDDGMIRITGSYVVLEGFEIMRSRGRGMMAVGKSDANRGTNIAIKNLLVHDNRNAGIHVLRFDNVLIEDNVVWHSSDYARYRRFVSLPWPGSIHVKYCDKVAIRGNTSFNNYGEGILLSGCNACLVEDNTVYDNMSTNLFLNISSNGTIQRNFVYCTEPDPARGISLGLDYDIDPGTAYLTDNTVINNMVVGCFFNFSFHVYTGGGTDPGGRGALINTLIAHNTLVNAQGTRDEGVWQPTAIWIQPYPDHDNVRVENNIVLQQSENIATVPDDPAFHWSHNLWSTSPPTHAVGPGDIYGDPLLRDADAKPIPGNTKAKWYKLQESSPARDAAKVVEDVTEDYFGTARNPRPDIGAHEYE